MHDSMMQINPNLNLMNIRNAPFEFDRMLMGTRDHSVQAAIQPGNDWGIGNLDEIQFRKELLEIYSAPHDINEFSLKLKAGDMLILDVRH